MTSKRQMREQLAEMTETANKFCQLWYEQSRAIAVVIAEIEAIKSRKGTKDVTQARRASNEGLIGTVASDLEVWQQLWPRR